MVLLQHKLNVKLSQRQILTPGLVQMVSVLALNKLELKDMINAEMVENPVLEELEDSVPMLDDVGARKKNATGWRPKRPRKSPCRLRTRRKIRLKRLILVRFSRSISIRVTAARERWKRSKSLRSRTSCRNRGT